MMLLAAAKRCGAEGAKEQERVSGPMAPLAPSRDFAGEGGDRGAATACCGTSIGPNPSPGTPNSAAFRTGDRGACCPGPIPGTATTGCG